MPNRPLYKIDSTLQTYQVWSGRIIICVAIISAALTFDENPIGISIVLALLLIILLCVSNESISVYTDKFIYNEDSLIKLFPKKIFNYQDIIGVNYEDSFNYGIDTIAKELSVRGPSNRIEIMFLNKETSIISTNIEKDGIKEAIKMINYQLSKYQKKSQGE